MMEPAAASTEVVPVMMHSVRSHVWSSEPNMSAIISTTKLLRSHLVRTLTKTYFVFDMFQSPLKGEYLGIISIIGEL